MKIIRNILHSKKSKHIRKTIKQLSLESFQPIGIAPYRIPLWDVLKLRFEYRRKETTLHLNKHTLTVSDAYWFLPSFKEIFEDEIYKFESDKEDPTIIDCGSNIGLSVLYFKHLFPKAKISGYEPDPYLFGILNKNLSPYKFQDVTLIQNAVWKDEGILHFHQDRSMGGSLITTESNLDYIEVPAIRLKNQLVEHVDLLKIDIEGAEYDVLLDCSDALGNVENIFVEYHGIYEQIHQFRHLLELLEKSGFKYHIKEADPIVHPFIKRERERTYSLQFNVFAFRDD